MRVKTSALSGAALDWAVAQAEGFEPFTDGISWIIDDVGRYKQIPKYSTDWTQGGPIIEREGICIGSGMDAPTWYANEGLGKYHQFGSTPLVAAMRCYVASKLGEEVEIPNELSTTQGE